MKAITHLSGGALISQGLMDIAAHRLTPASCLIAIARGRLMRGGLVIEENFQIPNAEHGLYALLRAEAGDAYSRYNAIMRQLASFAYALEQEEEQGGTE